MLLIREEQKKKREEKANQWLHEQGLLNSRKTYCPVCLLFWLWLWECLLCPEEEFNSFTATFFRSLFLFFSTSFSCPVLISCFFFFIIIILLLLYCDYCQSILLSPVSPVFWFLVAAIDSGKVKLSSSTIDHNHISLDRRPTTSPDNNRIPCLFTPLIPPGRPLPIITTTITTIDPATPRLPPPLLPKMLL